VSLPKQNFKRLIVDPATGKYLAPGGIWTDDEEEAINFMDISSALFACAQHKIHDAEVLLRFTHHTTPDVRLPMRHRHQSASDPARTPSDTTALQKPASPTAE